MRQVSSAQQYKTLSKWRSLVHFCPHFSCRGEKILIKFCPHFREILKVRTKISLSKYRYIEGSVSFSPNPYHYRMKASFDVLPTTILALYFRKSYRSPKTFSTVHLLWRKRKEKWMISLLGLLSSHVHGRRIFSKDKTTTATTKTVYCNRSFFS